MDNVSKLPLRSAVNVSDTWDLSRLFEDDAGWERDFEQAGQQIKEYEKYRGALAGSAATLAEFLTFDLACDRLLDRLGSYAFLRTSQDQADAAAQARAARYQNLAMRAAQAASFMQPEIMAIADETMRGFLAAAELAPYQLLLERMLRNKPHTLSDKEERLLAMQGEMAGTAGKAFRQLLDADMKFGVVEDPTGQKLELTTANVIQQLQSPNRAFRQTVSQQFYEEFKAHENTLGATLNGSIQTDVYYARARNYDSALSAALFADNVPRSVYDNLIAAVRKNLPAVHRFYDLRRRKMNLDSIHIYDCYVPILADIQSQHSWDQAAQVILEALAPLGSEYCSVLEGGLRGRWCDRYPNQGKQSGAFSAGSYDGDPYILMNYKPTVLNDVFTLAHEAGHSMHSYYSTKSQPYQYSRYTIFVAEVASTFNEQLLAHHMLKKVDDPRMRAYLINNEIDDIRSTIIRQTMFAEFEKITHEMAEAGEPLTVAALKDTYRKLLEAYFGPEFALDDYLSLECLRIPHFYRAFYVYKYATGISAAIALSKRVREGGPAELNAYLNFLQGGCSKWPLPLLRDAGVDLEQPGPVDTALAHFASLVDELETLLA